MATITKYVCDCCKSEVKGKDELYVFSYLDTGSYLIGENIILMEKEVCIDCFFELSENSLSILYGTKKWLEKNIKKV